MWWRIMHIWQLLYIATQCNDKSINPHGIKINYFSTILANIITANISSYTLRHIPNNNEVIAATAK